MAEHDVYQAIVAAVPKTDLWRWITRLGSGIILFPASVFLIVLLPRQFLRHWWVWIAVMLVASGLEGLAKAVVGRPRPETLRPGFPSGHTAAAAAFYLMVAHFAAGALRHRWAKWISYAVAAALIVLVALSRMALRVHWPLDVLGGAALGVGVSATAVWWYKRHPDVGRLLVSVPPVWRHAIYRWQNVIQLVPAGLLVLGRPLAFDDSRLDLAFDVSGGVCIAAGFILRLWVAGLGDKRPSFTVELPTWFDTGGPYAYMRQPLPFSTLLVGVGLVLLAERSLGMTLIPAALIVLYRITIPLEEAHLAARFGTAYTDYCARVPRFPRGPAVVVAASIAMFWRDSTHWRSIRQELPALVTTLALTALAKAHEYLPHVFR